MRQTTDARWSRATIEAAGRRCVSSVQRYGPAGRMQPRCVEGDGRCSSAASMFWCTGRRGRCQAPSLLEVTPRPGTRRSKSTSMRCSICAGSRSTDAEEEEGANCPHLLGSRIRGVPFALAYQVAKGALPSLPGSGPRSWPTTTSESTASLPHHPHRVPREHDREQKKLNIEQRIPLHP